MMAVNQELVKRLAELVDGDSWQMADLLVDEFPAGQWGDGGKAKTGLRQELDQYSDSLRRHHGVILAGSTMREYRMTAIRWPQEDRFSSASFTVHLKLKGPDRQSQMAKYLRKKKREGGQALSAKDVARYRADEKPNKPLKPFPDRVRQRLESTAKSMLIGGGVKVKRDDWWNSSHVNDEQRAQFARELRSLASRMTQAPKDDIDGDNPGALAAPEGYGAS